MTANASSKNSAHSPSVWGAVTINTDFTHGGNTYVSRAMWASADGTITVDMEDGTQGVTKQVSKGLNVFRCTQVSDLGGLTLEWQA